MYVFDKLRQKYSPCLTVEGAPDSRQEVAAGDLPPEVFLPVVGHWFVFAVEHDGTRGTAAVKLPSGTREQGVHFDQLSRRATFKFALLAVLI